MGIYHVAWSGKGLLLSELPFLFSPPQRLFHKGMAKPAQKLQERSYSVLSMQVRPINTGTVHIHTVSTTTTDRWPSNVRRMASSLEWEVPTASEQEIAGKMINLLKLLEWLWSLCLNFVCKCYTYDDHIYDKRKEHPTRHRTSSWGRLSVK